MLVSVSRYQAITGDTTTAASAVSALIEEATEELEEVLQRPLEADERTERMIPTRDGYLWPKATPLATATGYTIDGHGLIGARPFDILVPGYPLHQPAGVDVTYTGGWTADTVPRCIARDIALAAYVLGHPNAVGIAAPVGAKSVSVGDQSVTWATTAPGNAAADQLAGVWSRRTLAYRYRVERGV